MRAHELVQDFGVESPALSELFLAATGEDPSRAALADPEPVP